MMPRLLIGSVLAALVCASPAYAQATGTSTPDSSFGGRLFVHFEAQSMAASDSFDVVTGSTMMKGLGAGLEVDGLWRSVFARVSASRFSQDGERVFIHEGEVFPLGVPMEITMTPIELALGWRFKAIGSRGIVPYIGGGALIHKYREHTEGDTNAEEVNETYNGFTVFGGIEVPVWKRLSAGAEVGWRKAKVNEPGGAMAAFGEDDLGGVTFRAMVSFRK
jgi:hypothetical protein